MLRNLPAPGCVVALTLIACSAVHGDDESKALEAIAAKAYATLEANLKAMQDEDLDAAVATIHPKSPTVAPTRQVMAQMFAAYDLKYELVERSFVGLSGEYAVVRVKQRTSKVEGGAFRNNVVDMMHVLRRDGDDWKIWQSAVLSIEYE